MRFELMYESFFKIIEGIPLTLQVVSISTVLGLILAIIVALMRISGRKSMSIPAYYFHFYNSLNPPREGQKVQILRSVF